MKSPLRHSEMCRDQHSPIGPEKNYFSAHSSF
jgi:hypothetical protein